MGLFTKKFDLEKDKLIIKFNPDEKRYAVYIRINNQIEYKELNRKTKKILDKKNKELLENHELMELEMKYIKIRKRSDELKKMGYECHSFEVMGNVNNGSMSKEMEEYLKKLTNEEKTLLGIHRVGAYLTQQQIEDILINGLIITSHLGSGAISNKQLSDNVSYYPNNETIIKELMFANVYKNSTGSILIRIPDQDLTGNIFTTNNDGETVLNPKYILGYVPVDKNHHIDTIVTREQVIKKYTKPTIPNSNTLEELYTENYSNIEINEETKKRK